MGYIIGLNEIDGFCRLCRSNTMFLHPAVGRSRLEGRYRSDPLWQNQIGI
jgi:hypothetical protein